MAGREPYVPHGRGPEGYRDVQPAVSVGPQLGKRHDSLLVQPEVTAKPGELIVVEPEAFQDSKHSWSPTVT